MKILVVFGTRPEAIKMAPLVKMLKQVPGIETSVCVTAQHREMLDQVLRLFEITPEYDLNIMTPGQTLSGIAVTILQGLDPVLVEYAPDLVLVHGDTSTTFVATLASFYRHIPVGHVEAGLRTGNLKSPWPEEANRVLTGRLASLHFAPTSNAHANLLAEGVKEDQVWVTGNTVIDALLWVKSRLDGDPEIRGASIVIRFLSASVVWCSLRDIGGRVLALDLTGSAMLSDPWRLSILRLTGCTLFT